jgi:hypothetical protein
MVLVSWAVPVLIPVFILAVVALFVWAFRSAKREQEAAGQPDDGAAAAAPEPREIEVSCPCSEKFRVIVNEPGVAVFTCPKCRRQLRVDTSGGDL